MAKRFVIFTILSLLLLISYGASQTVPGGAMSELTALQPKVANLDTRTRVDALHRVWSIGLASPDSEVKLKALELLAEPVGSSSDHIRMPAVYAMADIANSTEDAKVKVRALELLAEPLQASQVPIRDVAVDAVNLITKPGSPAEVIMAAVHALGYPIKSGNNGVRMPAMYALLHAVKGSNNDAAFNAALELLSAPLATNAAIGGMEARMMAIGEVERIGLEASATGTKANAMSILRSYRTSAFWEPEAKRRAEDAAIAIQNTMKPAS